MIDIAKKAGCNAVKFQTYIVDQLVSKKTPLANYQKKMRSKNMNMLLKKYSFNKDQFIKINNYCKRKKIIFLSTPFDIESSKFLNLLKVPAFKISSGDLDNFMLLDYVKKFRKPIIISTGMASHQKIRRTLKYLNMNKNKLAILHCISDYPTKISDTQLGNLKYFNKLKYIFGFSDHTIGNISSNVAVALGAKIIEKHITLDNNMSGPDHKMSLNCKYLKNFVSDLKSINLSSNNRKRYLTKKEKQLCKILRRSLTYKNDLCKNSVLKIEDIASVRTNFNGIHCSEYLKVVGKKIKRKVIKNSFVKENDFY